MRPAALRALGLAVAACSSPNEGFDVPAGYRLVYAQDFAHQGSLGGFLLSDPDAWDWGMEEEPRGEDPAELVTFLELKGRSDYTPPHRSPLSIALIEEPWLGDFVLEADLMQTGHDYAHRDLCLFFGFVDAAHFYYAHLARDPDERAHNIFLVDGAARRRVAELPAAGVEWGGREWHRIRLERTLRDGAIRVYFDDMQTPVLEAADLTHTWGRVGFGSFDDTGRFTSVLVWGPDSREERREHGPASPFVR